MKKLIIFGKGQIAEIFSEYFEKDSDYEVVAYCADDEFCKNKFFRRKPLIPFSSLKKNFPPKNYKIFLAISYKNNNLQRKNKFIEIKKKGYKFANYISSKSNFIANLKHGENIAVLENQSIQPFVKIENNVFIWSGCVLGHHSVIKSHTWITSGANIGGNVKISEKCFLGLNSTVGQMVKIGENCFLGANSLITKNLKKNSVCINNDTKIFKLDTKNFYRLTNFR